MPRKTRRKEAFKNKADRTYVNSEKSHSPPTQETELKNNNNNKNLSRDLKNAKTGINKDGLQQ